MRNRMKHLGKAFALLLGVACSTSVAWGQAGRTETVNLIPDTPSEAPDYLCTWNLQGYLTSYKGSEGMRKVMTEKSLLGTDRYEGWLKLYPKIQKDLIFVMDDSWDIPADVNNKNDNPYLGRTELDESRFPSFKGTPTERLKALTDTVKALGWKGLGGWICAQKADLYENVNENDYWTERLKAADEAGFAYWKVDWGKNSRNEAWRWMLTELGRKYAPSLVIEHAMKLSYIEFSDTYRTYDVENIIAQPVTIQRVCDLLPYQAKGEAKGIINCEDEPYIAAGLGCAIGVMRHPFAGNVPDGNTDHAFPATVRDLKHRINEVERAVRWHRIALPFGVDGQFYADSVRLKDYWEYRENESWIRHEIGSLVKGEAPARVSRRMPLPIVSSTDEDRPYVLASKYPNGAVAIATIGRTLGRQYVSKEVSVSIEMDDWFAPIGIFGYYKDLTVNFATPLSNKGEIKVLAQDLAGDQAVDITKKVTLKEGKLILPGKVLREVGLMNASPDDVSDPGLVVKVCRK